MEAMQEIDDHVAVRFYMGSVPNQVKSDEAGHPVFDQVPFIEARVPGDRNSTIDTPVTPAYKARYARAWKMFESTQSGGEGISGMPLKEWAAITRSQVDELAYLHIFTVEQLVSVADAHASKIFNFHELRRKAETYLKQAQDAAHSQKLAADNDALQTQLNAMKEQFADLSQKFDEYKARDNGNEQHGSGGRTNRSK